MPAGQVSLLDELNTPVTHVTLDEVERLVGEMQQDASRPRLRVLHVVNGEHYSGAERVQDLLALRLPDFGVDVGFACIKPVRFPTMRLSEVPLARHPMRFRFDISPALRIARLIRREGYHLLHAHTPRSALVASIAGCLTRTPLVYHAHSPTSRDTTNTLRNKLNAWTERASLVGAAGLIAVSGSVGKHLKSIGYRDDRVTVAHNGVPGHALLPPRQPPRGQWTLGTVALFRPRKGLEVLLEALAELRRWGHRVTLRAVGPFETPEYEAKIRNTAARLKLTNAIEWTGFTRDVPAELQRMDLFVLPSLFGEGLPMVVLEAMAAGVPVVATDVEGVTEAIRDGIDGVIAQPGDHDKLAAALLRIISGNLNWESLRSSAHRRWQDRFSDVSMARQVAAVYRQVASRQRKLAAFAESP